MTSPQNAGPSSEQLPIPMQALYPARRRTLAGMWWAVRTALRKKRMVWEDRWGLFRYQHWIKTVEEQALQALRLEAKAAEGDALHPLFVIAGEILSHPQVEKTHKSLQQLTGTDWTLALLVSKTASHANEEWLSSLASTDHRVCVIRVDSPVALSQPGWHPYLANLPGDWVIPLRAGDQISPAWPFVFRAFRRRFPQADLFYWDEDQYAGERADAASRSKPFLKPGWSPELLFSINYVESGAFRKSYLLTAARDMDLLAAARSAKQAARIPVILQHRIPPTQQELQAARAQHWQAVVSYLTTIGMENPSADADAAGNLLVRWNIDAPLVSIIIPTRENLEYLKRCLTSLLERTRGVPYEIILMDDHSRSPEVLAYYRELEEQHVNIHIFQNQEAFNYSRVNNQGARHAKGSLLLFLNNDVEILDGGWLLEMVRWALMPGVGMVGARLLYPDTSIQHAGIVLGMTGHAGHLYAGKRPAEIDLFISPECCRNVSAVTGACMLVRREVFEQVGGFDEELILVFNDVDLCLRVHQAGWRIVYTPAATLIHYEGRSRSRYMPPRDIRLGAERLRPVIEQGDPYYHPGLSLEVNWPALRRSWEPGALQRLDAIVRYKG